MNRDHGSVYAILWNGWFIPPHPFSQIFSYGLIWSHIFVHMPPQVYKGSWAGRVVSWFYRTFMDSFPPKMTNGLGDGVNQNKYP